MSWRGRHRPRALEKLESRLDELGDFARRLLSVRTSYCRELDPGPHFGTSVARLSSLPNRVGEERLCFFEPPSVVYDKPELRQELEPERVAWRQERHRAAEQLRCRSKVSPVRSPEPRGSEELRRSPRERVGPIARRP
jgi:hypothetical protein